VNAVMQDYRMKNFHRFSYAIFAQLKVLT
jgi:hypothetical protein